MKDLEKLHTLAQKAEPESKVFFRKNKKQLVEADRLVHQLHDEIFEEIDCLQCGNCCKTLGPGIYDRDVERLAKVLRIKPSQVVEQYLEQDNDGSYVFKSMPCPFLMSDNYCSVYEHRPKACREYPHTDRKKFYQLISLTIKNTYTCPAAFELLERLKQRLK